ncbi:MAG: helix-turn-helix domain-containing protein [Lactobacillales bacterium]|jgi:transcriptional regulator with XRE-family HTH domain|nr:helix-turn-helix domain-containing protein [Lactobacillales bacterium]
MIWDFGKVYQKIRKEKGLTQTRICGDLVSRTTLSKIENCHSVPSYETFAYLLKQVNMSFDEFEYVCNGFKLDGRMKIFSEFDAAISNENVSLLATLREDCVEFLKKNHDLGIENLLIAIDYLILVHENVGIENVEATKLINLLWSKLEAVDTWYYNEIKMINCILFYFPTETVLNFSVKLIDSIKRYRGFSKDVDNFCCAIYTNLSTFYLYKNLYSECLDISRLVTDLAQIVKRYDVYCLSNARIGLCIGDKQKIQDSIKTLEFFGEDDLAKEIEVEVKRFASLLKKDEE